MVGLPRDRTLRVKWTLFRAVYNPVGRDELWESVEAWENSVYVICDPRGRPLYIGRATRGFGNRYWGDLQAMSAWGYGARNRLYVGRIEGARGPWYDELERELVARESKSTHRRVPRYNRNHKEARPAPEIRLRHTGDSPRFHHLEGP